MGVLVVTILSAVGGVLLATSQPRRIVSASVAVVCALPCVAFIGYYAHVLDGAAYYEWRSSPWTDLLAGLVGVSGGVAASLVVVVRRRIVACAIGAACAMALVTLAFAKPVLTRMPQSWVKDTWKGDVCIQSTPATCGPCAAATLLRSMGVADAKESELAREASATTSGTLNWLLARALRERGIAVRFRDVASLDDVKAPAIIGVRLGSIGHFLALLGRDERGAFIIGEPLRGRLVLTPEQFAARYTFDAFAMELDATALSRK